MIIHRKEALLANHAFSRLRLGHAALVESYPCDLHASRMPLNRVLVPLRTDGAGEAVLRDPATGQRWRLRRGHLYFIPCNRAVDLRLAADVQFASLQFNLDVFYGVDVLEGHPVCEDLAMPGLGTELAGLLSRDAGLHTLCRINEILYGLCARWIGDGEEGLMARLERSRRYAAVLEHVRLASDASTTVARLAAIAGMRPDVFSRSFARDLGVTPREFLAATVTRKATEMLLAPDATVGGIAEALGFSSEFYFSHFIRRRTGMSPTAYRHAHRGPVG